ncbi:MAG: type II and III secretion system protein family protein [Rhizobiales bacterium]|nr:type II and III secretion system protein family protein [Hyphomicrobiales bacterium]
MFMNFNNSYLARPVAKAGFLLAGLVTAATLAFSFQALTAPRAQATDLDISAAENDGRFVRIGLNKSVVVKLPGDARDVIVGNPEIVDAVVRSKNTAYLFARKPGQTNVFFFDANGQQILNLDLEVALDPIAIRKLLQRSLPGTRITVDTVNNNVVLGGMAQSQLEAKTAVDLATQFVQSSSFFQSGSSLINTIKVAGEDQVMLKVKVVEIRRDVLKQLGVDFQALIKAGNFAFNLSNMNPFANQLLSPAGGYAAAYSGSNGTFDSAVRAMESDGLLRTLAEPNLTAITGADAKFLAGGEFPYCVDLVRATLECLKYEYKEYGVSLNFTPTVLDQGRINLKIKTEVSEFAPSVTDAAIPTLNKRTAETVLEMPSGGSMMIAGLIRNKTSQTVKGTPGLKNLPVLGALFRSRDFEANETELVVLVTPYLVRPTGEKQLTTPDEGYNTPTDRQTILLGRLNKVYGGGGKAPDGTYHGNVGFIVE